MSCKIQRFLCQKPLEYLLNKKKPELPTVTNVPVPLSDNPIVIDLPAGQKLVLGKLASGTVIEVATWHGTGRPDSRTSRMMFGISSTAPSLQENSSQQAAVPSPSTAKASRIQREVNGKRPSLLSKIQSGIASISKKKPSHSVDEKIEELDIEAFLDSLKQKSENTNPIKSPQKKPTTKTKKAAPVKIASVKKKASASPKPRK
jgi:hypothetical protein